MHVTPRSRSRAMSCVESFGLGLAEAAGGLVEHDDARTAAHGRGDLHQLLLRDGEGTESALDVEAGARSRRAFRLRAVPSPGVETRPRRTGSAARHRFSATERLSQKASSWCTIADAGRECVARAGEADGRPAMKSSPGIRCVNAGEDLSERALARAVLAAECVARARGDLERHIGSASTPGKRLVTCSKRTAGSDTLAATVLDSGTRRARR